MARSKYKKNDPEFAQPPADPRNAVTNPSENSGDEERLASRSAKKRESDALKALGMQLAELSPRALAELDISEKLFKAITHYQSITSNSAKRRQRGYIGGLLREDPDEAKAIEKRYVAATQHDANAKRLHLELENWRERLIAEDSALTEFLTEQRQSSAQELRLLIRRVRSAKDEAQRKKATRALYRKLASIF